MTDDYLEMLRRKLKRLDKDPGTRRSMLAAVTASEIRRLEQEAEACSE